MFQAPPKPHNAEAIEALRKDLVGFVEQKLSPIALRYRYTTTPLEATIKWRPLVLILGNYSSGKSTLINELLGIDVQKTGQAPTDDSFTVITGTNNGSEPEERDGNTLLRDSQYPFAELARHGQRFASHFRLKSVKSPALANLALIDTPGMLDSVSERDRGYAYQEVIGDLARIADLILVMFDPHKAGTIRETYESLRRTLPQATYEDRVVFVLNRIDECTNLNDLLRVYGTLCWNISQMTGRKDIPTIHLSYSTSAHGSTPSPDFLSLVSNQREELKRSILAAPKHRLDHLISFIEEHGERLSLYLSALVHYSELRRRKALRLGVRGGLLSLLVGGAGGWGWHLLTQHLGLDPSISYLAGGIAAVAAGIGSYQIIMQAFLPRFHRSALKNINSLATLDTQRQREAWESLSPTLKAFLERSGGRITHGKLKADATAVQTIWNNVSQTIRQRANALRT